MSQSEPTKGVWIRMEKIIGATANAWEKIEIADEESPSDPIPGFARQVVWNWWQAAKIAQTANRTGLCVDIPDWGLIKHIEITGKVI